jgi:CRISPR-associated protein Cas1
MSTLFVDRRGTHLELDAGALVFRENGERIGTVPLAPLTRVFLRGHVTLESSLLGQLGERGVGVVILSGKQGKPSLLLGRAHNDARRRVEQIRRSLDPVFCLDYARRVVATKIERQEQWFDQLRNKDMHARYELTHAMRQLQEHRGKLGSVTRIESLRGVEGSAAHVYFEGLRAVVPESLQFKGRNRRPPRDPFNALLSLTYTLIHAETAIALHGAGLDPCVGFYHQLDFGRESLACDVVETIRPLADRLCLQMVRQQTLTKDHFSQSSAGCLLGKAGRTRYYAAYEEEVEPLRQAIAHSVANLREAIQPGDDDELPSAGSEPDEANDEIDD